MKKCSKLSKSLERRIRTVIFRRIGLTLVIRHFIKSNFILSSSSVICFIGFTISIFSFLIFSYFNSHLNTDLVVPENVKMFNNYDEIMEAGVKPVFLEGMTYHQDLKFAPESSKSKKLWNWAVRKFGEKELFVKPEMLNFAHYCVEGLKGEILLFGGQLINTIVKTTSCELLGRPFDRLISILSGARTIRFNWRRYTDPQVYIRTDPSSKSYIKSIVLGKRVVDSKRIYLMVNDLFHRMFQYGHLQSNLRKLENSNFLSLQPGLKSLIGPSVPERAEVKYICRLNNLPIPKTPQVNRFNLSNLKFSLLTCSCMIICSFIRLFYEIWLGKKIKRKRNHSYKRNYCRWKMAKSTDFRHILK